MTASRLRQLGFEGKILEADSPDYESLLQRPSDVSLQNPRFIVRPVSRNDVSAAVKFATQSSLDLAVKCGGHHFSKANSVTDGVVIDMGAMREVKIDVAKNQVTVSGGCLWGDVYSALEVEGLICVGGGVHVVGCGGHITGGGYGPLSRKYGLACDNVLSMTVVTADGGIVTANEHENSDLSWAIKGSSSSFGVVTQFVLRTYPAPGPSFFRFLGFSPKMLPRLIELVSQHSRQLGDDQRAVPFLYFVRGPPPVYFPALLLGFYAFGKPEDYEEQFKPYLGLEEKPFSDDINIYKNLVELSHGLDEMLLHGSRRKLNSSILFTGLWTGMAEDLWERFLQYTNANPDSMNSKIFFEFHHSARLRPELSSYPVAVERHGMLIFSAEHNDESNDDSAISFLKEVAEVARSYQARNDTDLGYNGNATSMTDLKIEDVYGPNVNRLLEVKARYDPNNVFNRWHRLEPEPSASKG